MNCQTWAEQKAYLISKLDEQIAKAEKNLKKHLDNVVSISNSTGGVNGESAIDEKLSAMAQAELNKLNTAREQIETTFGGINAAFDKGVSGLQNVAGNTGSNSSGNKGSSSSTEKEIANLESLVDRYTDYNNAVTKVENALKALQIQQENASDEDRVKLIQKEIDLLNQKRVALQNLQGEQKRELDELKKSLSNNGFNFNSDGSISNINQQLEVLRNKANALSGEAKEAAIANVKSVSEAVNKYNELLLNTIPDTENSINDIKNTIIEAQKDISDVLSKQRDEYIDNLEKEADALKKSIQKKKDLLEKSWKEEDREDQLAEKQNNLNDLEDQLTLALRTGDDELIKSIRLQIQAAQKEIDDFIRDNEREDASDRYEEEMDKIDENLDKQIEEINKKLSDEEILKLVQQGVTDLSSALNNIDSANKAIRSSFVDVGAIIQNDWIANLDTFISKYNSISSINPSIGFTADGISANGGIVINAGDLIIQGDVIEDTIPDMQKMLDQNNKNLLKLINEKVNR